MRALRPLASLLFVVCTLDGGTAAHAAAGPPRAGDAARLAAEGRRPAPGKLVVKLRRSKPGVATTGTSSVDALLQAHGLAAVRPLVPSGWQPRKPTTAGLERVAVVSYTDGTPPEELAAVLSRDPAVEYAEPHWEYVTCAIPNDPLYGTQSTPLGKMTLPLAWDVTKAEQGSVLIAIVDGGTQWQHADLLANTWTNPGETPGNGIDDDGNGFSDDVHGWNFGNGSADPTGFFFNNGLHGTHVAGIACARTNNAQFITGTSWNARMMPICASSDTEDGIIAFGYEGILYAADNGADIINCSWGGLGTPNEFEREVIDYAWSQGAAIVAAAGNQATSQPHFPSAYPHVLSVANVDNQDVRDAFSNYGTTIDVSAQGVNITSTVPTNTTAILTGTSMSSPAVAGICALVKTRWPGYSQDQVMERVRVTSSNIDAANPARAGMLGYGRVSAYAALTRNTPAIRIQSVAVDETDHDGVVEPGEIVTLSIQAVNLLAQAVNVSFRLRETSQYASVVDSAAAVAVLDSMETVTLAPLRFQVAVNAPPAHLVNCILAIQSGTPAYTDKDRFSVRVQPTFVTHTANNVTMTVTSVGKIGYATALGGTGSDGDGFAYKGGPSLLYEGAFLAGTSAARVSDAARTTSPPATADEFVTTPGTGTPQRTTGGVAGREEVRAEYDDTATATPLPVHVRQTSYAYPGPEHGDYVIVRLALQNTGLAAISGLRAGWFLDWDIDGGSFATNVTGFDAARSLGYCRDTSAAGPGTWVGVQVLTAPGATGYRGIVNDPSAAPDWGTYDGFSDAEKWDCLSGGIVHPAVGPEDVAQAIATGPFDVAPGDSVVVAFAFLGGDDLPSLQAHADAAALKWTHLTSGVPVELSDFTAGAEEGAVQLSWRVHSAAGVSAFRVFRGSPTATGPAIGADVPCTGPGPYAVRDAAPAGIAVYRLAEVRDDGGIAILAAVTAGPAPAAPVRTELSPPRPNPFNPETRIDFALAGRDAAQVAVFDARGRRVRLLWSSERVEPGRFTVRWDGRDDRGRAAASGVYFVQLHQAGFTETRRATLIE